MAQNNQLCRRSSRYTGADFNLYGLDPHGQKAHLAKHMYGPWQPSIVFLTRFSGRSQVAPRFGPPSSEQHAWIPRNFIENEPPWYYGRPSLSYLPPPLEFDLIAFDRLLSRPRSSIDDAGDVVQPLTLIVHGVWSLPVLYKFGYNTHQFHISTSISWPEFRRVASTYLRLQDTSGRLGYRINWNRGLEELHALQNSMDWRKTMSIIRQAAQNGIGGELVVLNLDAVPGLSSQTPEIETHAFDYPGLDEILQRLDSQVDAVGGCGLPYIDDRGIQGLRVAGMVNADDFTMLSPVDMSIISRIVPEKISVLYRFVEKIIEQVHEVKKEDIESLRCIRQEWNNLQNT
ncbi:hypothetical protein BDZ94DRAFT_1354740 [Collybia nuda]|uniref:Uncharacterized protein n=1 Tax=Collybia nuda TaxID=64659 RepID=A0A9P6CJD8_9AGAR|nr:hypothetical protein BDZ94DRAFT_1354740 [Collybia nuda]